MNAFGTSAAATQMTRSITSGSHRLFGSDKYLNYDRTDGNITLTLPKISTYITENARSGNTITLNYILSDLTPADSLNTITILCADGDNINGLTNFVTNNMGRYSLQATPAGWLFVNQISTQSKGIFNTSGLNFLMNFSNEDFSQYYAVYIGGSNIMGASYVMDSSSFLEYFNIRLNTDIVSVTFSNNSILKGLEFFNAAVLETAIISDNPLLTELNLKHVGSGDGVLESVTISNCPLLDDCDFIDNALNQTSVDHILDYLDSTGVINGVLDLSGGTNSAPTGGASNANYLSLVSKGWTVSIN